MYPYNDMRNQDIMMRHHGSYFQENDDRFFWAPFVVGGLAGTALGYGIANNNQINNQGYYYYQQPAYYPYPTYIYPSQNTYYFDHM